VGKVLRLVVMAFVAILLLGLSLWGGLAIWYTVPLADGGRAALAIGFVALGLVGVTIAAVSRRRVSPLLPFALASLTLAAWWVTITPSNDRNWQPDVARLPTAEIDGDRVTLRNVRDFDYRTATDFTPRWHDRTLDLGQLDRLDLYAVHWMGDTIAHTMVSFGFADADPVVISIETRKEVGETYSTLAGFFRRYELIYVVGEERDLVALRTTWREPTEDVYLFNIDIPKANIRHLFEAYLAEIMALDHTPKFYNTATTNCTTDIVSRIRTYNPGLPLSWKMLLSGHFAELIYSYGAMDQTLPFPELRRQSLINDRAQAAQGAPDFSKRIREGLPGTAI
jgi:hypothetical protein